MKEHKTLNNLNTKIQNLRDTSDEMYIELNAIIKEVIFIKD